MSQEPAPPSLVVEQKSYSELAIERYLQISELQEVIELNEDEHQAVSMQTCLPKQLTGCIFVGHKATDLDSIASAIGAAELFQGVAARASEVNNETAHALRIWNLDVPSPYVDVSTQHPSRMTCIVDHNQKVQCPDRLDYDKLIGVIDHHAMQGGTVSTSSPIYVNIQPWGSACTIIATMFFQARRSMSRQTAGILLSGILSDTLNLRSPTTTEYDCLAVSLLSNFAKVDDVNELARSLFKAKSMELLRCTPHQLVRGDLKTFECHCRNPANLTAAPQIVRMAFGVIETTDVSGLVTLKDKLIYELRALKAEESKDLVFLALVDIVSLNTQLVLVGSREVDLATRVFNGTVDPVTGLMHLHNLVSRKKDFIPPLEHYLSKKGWAMPELSADEQSLLSHKNFGRVELECTEFGCQTVRGEAPAEPSSPAECTDADCKDSATMCDDGAAAAACAATSASTTTDATKDAHHHPHRHHHHSRLTAADVTRRILSSYKLRGPHIPTNDEMQQAISFVLGSANASISQGASSGAMTLSSSSPSHSAVKSTPITTKSTTLTTPLASAAKRTHSQLEDNNNNDMLVPLGLENIPQTNKRQKPNTELSPLLAGRKSPFTAPRSPTLVATQNMHQDLDRPQAEGLVQELLAFTTKDNEVISTMESTLQLPSTAVFKKYIQDLVSNQHADPSAKFLLCALTHALSDIDELSQLNSDDDSQ